MEALSQGVIAGAGLDVLPEELLPADSGFGICLISSFRRTTVAARRTMRIVRWRFSWTMAELIRWVDRTATLSSEKGYKKPCFCRAMFMFMRRSLCCTHRFKDGVSALRLSLM